MASQQVKIERTSCPMCGSYDIGSVKLTYRNKKQETIPVCNDCGMYMYPDTYYTYNFVIEGVAHDWASADDLKGVIEAILKKYMPRDDTRGMKVSVCCIGESQGDQVIYE